MSRADNEVLRRRDAVERRLAGALRFDALVERLREVVERFFVAVDRFLAAEDFFADVRVVEDRLVELDERGFAVERFFALEVRLVAAVVRRRGAVVAKTARRYSTICGQRRTLRGSPAAPVHSTTKREICGVVSPQPPRGVTTLGGLFATQRLVGTLLVSGGFHHRPKPNVSPDG
jgi:hypothetical protein